MNIDTKIFSFIGKEKQSHKYCVQKDSVSCHNKKRMKVWRAKVLNTVLPDYALQNPVLNLMEVLHGDLECRLTEQVTLYSKICKSWRLFHWRNAKPSLKTLIVSIPAQMQGCWWSLWRPCILLKNLSWFFLVLGAYASVSCNVVKRIQYTRNQWLTWICWAPQLHTMSMLRHQGTLYGLLPVLLSEISTSPKPRRRLQARKPRQTLLQHSSDIKMTNESSFYKSTSLTLWAFQQIRL